jgi:cation diffusion facilitator family transporter
MTSIASPQADALDAFRQDRTYLGADHSRNERRTWAVTAICAVTLVGLMAGGLMFGSMALLANGVHMAAHVAALLVSAGAYALARRHAADPRFAFGTGKLGYLAGFANAVVLAVTAVLIGTESLKRLLDPHAVDYHGALPLAAAGLGLNLICVWLLRPTRLHRERNDRDGDLNLSSAYLHLVADAGVSVVALGAMALGRYLGWAFLDPAAGLVGAVLVAHFSIRLLRQAGAALLDINPNPELTREVRERLAAGGEAVIDLHLWRLGPGHHAVIAVVAGDDDADAYRARLAGLPGLSHVTIEVRAEAGHQHHGHSHSHG